MKVSDSLRKAFKRFEGGYWWYGGDVHQTSGCFCAATAVGMCWPDSAEVKYLYHALPKWAQNDVELGLRGRKHWEYVAEYNDDPRCKFKHISALYGKAIKLAEIDEAEAAGLVGKARLLRVALALREAKDPKFDMGTYVHPCGTPACAMGHYAARTDLQTAFKIDRSFYLGVEGVDLLTTEGSFGGYSHQMKHFQITFEEWDKLFGHTGCGGAKTAIEAADYIEKFAHAKWETV